MLQQLPRRLLAICVLLTIAPAGVQAQLPQYSTVAAPQGVQQSFEGDRISADITPLPTPDAVTSQPPAVPAPINTTPIYTVPPTAPSQNVIQTAGETAPTGVPQVMTAAFQEQPATATAAPPAAAQFPQPPALGTVNPDEPAIYRLDELEGIALTYNPLLHRGRAEIDSAKGERVQAGLYNNPRFFTNNPEIWAGQNSSVNFGFRQQIPVKGKLRVDKAVADQLVRRNTAEYRLERARLVTEVRKQYYKALAAKHRTFLARYLTTITERGVAGARQLEQAGEGTQIDVFMLDTEYQRALIRQENAETNYRGALKQLAAIVGSSGIMIEDIEGTLFNAPPQFDEQDVKDFLANNSSYAEWARANLTYRQTQLRRAEIDPYPDMIMGPHYTSGTTTDSNQFWLTVMFEIPVWDLNQGNIRKTNANVHQAIEERQVTYNELHRKTSELFANHRAARDRAEQIRLQILPNAQQAHALIQDGYVKGQFNVNRVLQSQRNLAAVSSDYFDAAEKSWETAAELAGMLQLEQFP